VPTMRPNILLITADQHNTDVLGCYGNPVVRTPHIDSLAEAGVRFDLAFTPFAVCTPARTSIMTGQWAHHHGMTYNVNMGREVPPLSGDALVITALLKEAGYSTALIGKRHMEMEGAPNMYFDYQLLVEGKGQFTPHHEPDAYRRYLYQKGYDDEWKTWETVQYQRDFWVTSPFPEEDYIDTFIGRQAVAYLRGELREPFFLWLSFCSPHNTWDPPVPYDTLYDPATIPLPRRKLGELEGKPAVQEKWARSVFPIGPGNTPELGPAGLSPSSPGWGVFTAPDDPYTRISDERLRGMLAAYYATVTLVDKQIGIVLDTLEALGIRDNTLIIYASDHGDYLGNNWLFYKQGGFLYDSLVRVPLVCSWPDQVPEGVVSESLVSLIDLTATFARLADIPRPETFDGRDLFEGAMQGDRGFREAIFSERGNSAMIRTHEWKLVRYTNTEEAELYNLVEDPGEHENLYGRPGLEDITARLSQQLARWWSR